VPGSVRKAAGAMGPEVPRLESGRARVHGRLPLAGPAHPNLRAAAPRPRICEGWLATTCGGGTPERPGASRPWGGPEKGGNQLPGPGVLPDRSLPRTGFRVGLATPRGWIPLEMGRRRR
jgi:hypothetical protein